jgi:hypothetical protein
VGFRGLGVLGWKSLRGLKVLELGEECVLAIGSWVGFVVRVVGCVERYTTVN